MGRIRTMRVVGALIVAGILAACNGASDLGQAAVPLGDFSLKHNVVVAPKVQKVPLCRELETDVMTTMLQSAVAERFDRYTGDRLYHFGISIEGYCLAPPGVPVVAAPKSAMIIRITVWDDAANKKLTPTAHQITVFESLDQGPLVGSGYTKTAEEQFKNLSQNAVKQIETFLVRKNREEGWFNGKPSKAAATTDAGDDAPETLNAATVDSLEE
ncbi:hypothetical protein [Sulfitobacter guttiformis]|uniref:Lipoprotein n=1 Tax=Sulfitobacter guttiformis TaxID=74349 RepID=A0A420DQI6_9RHOB|nr:hypothetical protein [Sulfitobacter guttiformis]KIN73919.1 hypothetical protein Z949_3113 [Sulfitobacter guttiformis KCTC 32187]RKE96546.1 hypothetical protein C8N30_1111 [Sulfitobacter guttiformis]